jgi:hypothetical protein
MLSLFFFTGFWKGLWPDLIGSQPHLTSILSYDIYTNNGSDKNQ